MKPDYSSEDFPVQIDLGKTPPDNGPMDAVSEKKPKKYYPTLYVSDVKGLGDLPKSGWALIEFDRTDLTLRTTDDGDRVSAELKIKTLCLPESPEDDGEDMASALAKALMNAGHDEEESEEDEE